MINDLIKHYSLKNANRIFYNLVSHRDSQNHAGINGNVERHDVSQIEDRVQFTICLKYKRQGETCCTSGRMLPRHHLGGQEAGRATNQQSIHRVGLFSFTTWTTQSGRRYGSSEESQKHQKSNIFLELREKKQKCGTIMECFCEDEQHHMCMYEQGCTQSNMEKFKMNAIAKMNYVAILQGRAHYADQYKVVQPYRWQRHRKRPNNILNSNIVYSGKGKHDQSIFRSRGRTVVIMDMVTFTENLHGGILRHRTHGEKTIFYSVWCPITRLEQNAEHKLRRLVFVTNQWEWQFFWRRMDIRRMSIRTRGEHRYAFRSAFVHRCGVFFLKQTHLTHCAHSQHFHGSRSDCKNIPFCQHVLSCFIWVRKLPHPHPRFDTHILLCANFTMSGRMTIHIPNTCFGFRVLRCV